MASADFLHATGSHVGHIRPRETPALCDPLRCAAHIRHGLEIPNSSEINESLAEVLKLNSSIP